MLSRSMLPGPWPTAAAWSQYVDWAHFKVKWCAKYRLKEPLWFQPRSIRVNKPAVRSKMKHQFSHTLPHHPMYCAMCTRVWTVYVTYPFANNAFCWPWPSTAWMRCSMYAIALTRSWSKSPSVDELYGLHIHECYDWWQFVMGSYR